MAADAHGRWDSERRRERRAGRVLGRARQCTRKPSVHFSYLTSRPFFPDRLRAGYTLQAASCDVAERQAGEDLISALHAAISLTEPHAERFVIGPGQALLCDNYRMFHGRELFTGSRDLWRVWFWTDEASPEAISLAESLASSQI